MKLIVYAEVEPDTFTDDKYFDTLEEALSYVKHMIPKSIRVVLGNGSNCAHGFTKEDTNEDVDSRDYSRL